MKIDTERLARWEAALRPLATRLPPGLAVRLYSQNRRWFLARWSAERPAPRPVPPELSRTLWGLPFRAPLGNAAGLFKNGSGIDLAVRQGAGFYLTGTTTDTPRSGYQPEWGPCQPFAPYPRSGAASNRLGLPNDGHEAVAGRLGAALATGRLPAAFPVGASVAADPGADDEEAVAGLVRGLRAYDEAGVQFLEINESCPNTGEETLGGSALGRRLERIEDEFLARRARPLPVLVKLSVDTAPEQVPELVDLVVGSGFDGLVFGNTSTAYDHVRQAIEEPERPLFDRFVREFGGGVSGRPLRAAALGLVTLAARHLAAHPPGREFHLVRVGGVETAADVAGSLAAGASLCQWYTGLFDAFGRSGHDLYARLYDSLTAA